MNKVKFLCIAVLFSILNIASAEDIRWDVNGLTRGRVIDVQVSPYHAAYQYSYLTLTRGECLSIKIKFYPTENYNFYTPCRCYFLFMNQMIHIPQIQIHLYTVGGGYVSNHEPLIAYREYECSVDWDIPKSYPLLDGELIIILDNLFNIRIAAHIDR